MGLFNWKNGQDGNTPINATNLNLAQQQIVNTIYPVGAIYISTNSTSPKTLFGVGTWERIKDRFLLSASDTYGVGTTGGEAKHTLTIEEMPSHGHELFSNSRTAEEIGNGYWNIEAFEGTNYGERVNVYKYNTGANNTGGGLAHNNMPPYLAVYMWKRTA